MRYAPGHKEEARARMVAAAARGFKRKGFGGIGVDGLAKEAEVTSGAFYGHFASKEAAFKDVVVAGLDELRAGIETLRAERGADWIEVFIDFYLGPRRECELGESCALQSLSPDVQRADGEVKAAYETKLAEIARTVADGLPGKSKTDRMQRAWALLSMLSGGVTLARSAHDPATSAAIAAALRKAAIAIAR
jgi:TetR/AcrR family transcriptional regulator, transcriptional repressor for nem operon